MLKRGRVFPTPAGVGVVEEDVLEELLREAHLELRGIIGVRAVFDRAGEEPHVVQDPVQGQRLVRVRPDHMNRGHVVLYPIHNFPDRFWLLEPGLDAGDGSSPALCDRELSLVLVLLDARVLTEKACYSEEILCH